jgi:hypothetical protein
MQGTHLTALSILILKIYHFPRLSTSFFDYSSSILLKMWKATYKPLSEDEFESNEPLSEKILSLEQTTLRSGRVSRYLPSIQQTFNVVAILYVIISLPTLLSFLTNQRSQVYCALFFAVVHTLVAIF